IWYHFLARPFTCLFCCFFQPARFKREYEIELPSKHIIPTLRLILPIFLSIFPLSLVARWGLCKSPFYQYFSCALIDRSGPNIVGFLLATAGATTLGIGLGIVGGITGGIGLRIAGGIAVSITLGIGLGIGLGIVLGTWPSIGWGIVGGIVGSIAGGNV